MYQGTFPPSDPKPSAYSPEGSRHEEFDPTPVSASRRQWLFALGGVLVGLTVPASWSVIAGEVAPVAEDGAVEPVEATAEHETPRWALDLVDQSPETVIKWAGDLEMVAARYRTDFRLIPSFERLLEVVLGQQGPTIDAAGACAIRGLERLGARDVVATRRRQILARRDLSETQNAMAQVLESAAIPSSNK